jgi:Domain of unknown function (DUF5655)
MEKTRDWQRNREMWIRLLEEKTGKGVDWWKRRIKKEKLNDKQSLRAWLTEQGVTGYARMLLVMETFGYPDFIMATADQLINDQYADRPRLRPICDAVIEAARQLGAVVQARKTYVSLLTPRRTFARVQPTTKDRIDLGLRLDGQKPGGRLKPSKIHETMKLQIGLSALEEVDAEVRGWLRKAYAQNC